MIADAIFQATNTTIRRLRKIVDCQQQKQQPDTQKETQRFKHNQYTPRLHGRDNPAHTQKYQQHDISDYTIWQKSMPYVQPGNVSRCSMVMRDRQRYQDSRQGRRQVKVLPWSGELTTVTRPPCSSTIILTMASPNPWPLAERLIAPETW